MTNKGDCNYQIIRSDLKLLLPADNVVLPARCTVPGRGAGGSHRQSPRDRVSRRTRSSSGLQPHLSAPSVRFTIAQFVCLSNNNLQDATRPLFYGVRSLFCVQFHTEHSTQVRHNILGTKHLQQVVWMSFYKNTLIIDLSLSKSMDKLSIKQ